MNLDLLNTAANSFVDGAFDPADWPQALQQLADSVDAEGVILLPIKGRLPGVPMSEKIGEMMEFYFRHGWNVHDQRELGISKMLRTGIMVEQDFISPAMMKRSPFYQEYLRRFGMQWFAGVGFEADHEIWCAAIQRTSLQGPFTLAEQDALRSIRGRLTTAATLARRFSLARIEGMAAVFGALDTATVLVDRLGRVALANAKAETLIRDVLRVVKGEFALGNPAEQALLRARIASALADDRPGAQEPVIVRRENRRPLVVRVIPLPHKMLDCFTPACTMILITDPEDQPALPESLLQSLFGLTRAEAALASELAMGKLIAEYAAERGLAHSTAQQLMKHVLAKTGTHRQSQLVALIDSYRLAAGHTGG